MARRKHTKRLRRCAPRFRRLIVESFEPRQLLSSAPSGIDKQVNTFEDTAIQFAPTDFTFSDPLDSPANALAGIFVNGLTLQGGTLSVGSTPVNIGDRIDKTQIGALVFVPAADKNDVGTPKPFFTFQVQDNGGAAGGGTDTDPTPNTITISVTSIPDAPIGLDSSVTAIEDIDYSFQPTDFRFSDPNDSPPFGGGPLNSLIAIRITSAPPSNGTLKFAGVDAVPGQRIPINQIGQLVYRGIANEPCVALGTFAFQVEDDANISPGGANVDPTPNTMTINVASINNPPTGGNNTVVTDEDRSYFFRVEDFAFADVADNCANNLLSVVIVSAAMNGGVLMEDGVIQTPGDSISRLNIDQRKVLYVPPANKHGSPLSAFTFRVQDDGGTANGGVDLSVIPQVMAISVRSVNDPPIGIDQTRQILEGQFYWFTASDFPMVDPNDTPPLGTGPPNTLAVVFFTVPHAIAGEMKFNGTVAAPGNIIAVAVPDLNTVTFRPNTTTSIQFRVKDNGGTVPGGFDEDLSPNLFTFVINSVNGPPTGFGKALTISEDSPHPFKRTDFGFADPSDSPGDQFLAVKITTLPSQGSLTKGGSPVSQGAYISVADIDAGKLEFAPAANAYGPAYASFTFRVQDDGGTAWGGQDLDDLDRTMTIQVTSVNDPPVGEDRFLQIYCGPRTLSIEDFGYSDPNDNPPNDPLGVKIVSFEGFGTLTNAGSAIGPGQFMPYSDLVAGKLIYTPPAASIFGFDTIRFQVQDNGGTASGGTDLDPTIRTLQVRKTAGPAQPPSGSDNTVSMLEDHIYAFQLADFRFVDVNGDNLKSVRITSLPQNGFLLINNAPVEQGQAISTFDIAMRRFTFSPRGDATGTPYTNFFFQVQDDSSPSCGGLDLDFTPNTLTINVTPVNDPPQGTDWEIAVIDNSSAAIGPAQLGFADPLDSPPNILRAIKIITLPDIGSLTIHGAAVALGQTIAAADINAGSLRFVAPPLAHWSISSFRFLVQDDGGTANGGIDATVFPNTLTVHILTYCDRGTAPINRDNVVTALEDQSYLLRYGDLGFFGPFGDELTDLQGVKIVSLPARGTLSNNGTFVAPGQVIPIVDILEGRLKFIASPNTFGTNYAQFVVQIQDALFPICGDDGTGTISINVTPVNDPPQGSDKVLFTQEYQPIGFQWTDFGFSDPLDSPPNLLRALKIVTLPQQGTLTLFGQPVDAGQLVLIGSLNSLVFVPPVSAPPANTSFTFQVKDDGGTAFGGLDVDPAPKTMSIKIPVYCGERPSTDEISFTTLEDSPHVFTTTPADPCSIFNEWFMGLQLTNLPTTGMLQFNGVSPAANQFVSATDLASGKLQYIPSADANGPMLASFLARLDYSEGPFTADAYSVSKTVVVNVTPVNDPPSFTGGSNQNVTDESGPQAVDKWAAEISAGAPDEANQKLHFVVLANSNPDLFQDLPAIDANGTLTFTPRPNVPGSADISIALKDDGGTLDGGIDMSQPQTVTIHIAKLRPWHNAAKAVDVSGDGELAPGDALDVINFINAFDSRPVPADGNVGGPYYDVTGDLFIAPDDALTVINYYNAFGADGEGESDSIVPVGQKNQALLTQSGALDDTITLLAIDLAGQARRRTRCV